MFAKQYYETEVFDEDRATGLRVTTLPRRFLSPQFMGVTGPHRTVETRSFRLDPPLLSRLTEAAVAVSWLGTPEPLSIDPLGLGA